MTDFLNLSLQRSKIIVFFIYEYLIWRWAASWHRSWLTAVAILFDLNAHWMGIKKIPQIPQPDI